VAHTVAPDKDQRLVIDIAGGSTEFIFGRHYTPILTESLYMGCVSMHREYFPDGRITEADMDGAKLTAMGELEPLLQPYDPRKSS
jgi:exopolyphosphatase/guanosine-5'-triphosphate,3'-diphosphate pyrophosphatase